MSVADDANRLSNLSSQLPVETAQMVQQQLSEVLSQAVDILGPDHAAAKNAMGISRTALQCIGEATASMQQLGQLFTDAASNMLQAGS